MVGRVIYSPTKRSMCIFLNWILGAQLELVIDGFLTYLRKINCNFVLRGKVPNSRVKMKNFYWVSQNFETPFLKTDESQLLSVLLNLSFNVERLLRTLLFDLLNYSTEINLQLFYISFLRKFERLLKILLLSCNFVQTTND